MYQWLYLWFFSGKNVLPYVLVVPSGNLLRSWHQGYFRSGPLQVSIGTESSLILTCCESVNIGSPVGCKIYKFEDWNDINFFQKIIKIFKNFINASNQKYLRLKNDLKLFLSSINSFLFNPKAFCSFISRREYSKNVLNKARDVRLIRQEKLNRYVKYEVESLCTSVCGYY